MYCWGEFKGGTNDKHFIAGEAYFIQFSNDGKYTFKSQEGKMTFNATSGKFESFTPAPQQTKHRAFNLQYVLEVVKRAAPKLLKPTK